VYHLVVKTTAIRLRAAFIAAVLAWAALLIVVPLLASRAHVSTPESLLIVAVYAIGSAVCHQLPERSYHLWAAQMPVCARCAGIYFGAVAGVMAAMVRTAKAVRHKTPLVRTAEALRYNRPPVARGAPFVAHGFSRAKVRILLALAAAPTVLTLVYEWTTGVMPPHPIRAAAGASIGAAVAWLVVAAAENQVN